MNRLHRWLCNSDHWRRTLQQRIPWVIAETDLGPNVLEIGPGPGLTTDRLRTSVPRLTALEIDPDLAASLSTRLAKSNVRVIEGDATHYALWEFRILQCSVLHNAASRSFSRTARPGSTRSVPGFEAGWLLRG